MIKHFFNTRKSDDYKKIPFGVKDTFVMVNQVHGNDILIIDRPLDNITLFAEEAMQKTCDAIITNQRYIGIGVATADCLPILISDPVQSVIAAVHAGWKGTIKGILAKVICQMVYIFRSRVEDIVVGIGPAIGSCCYVVGKTVIEPLKSANPEWGKYLTNAEDGKTRLDLTALNIRQAEDVGGLEKNVFSIGLCTCCNSDLFFSYRGDGAGVGRMVSGIMM